MTVDSVKRKLTAILRADVKGYSRMMGEDEEGTYQTLTANLESIHSTISEHKGHVFSSPGDAIMAQFVSVVDAVKCAVEVQDKIEKANAKASEDRKMQFRIGINLGDVIEDGDRIYGDGVNIAARIETLAEAGGVSISRTVYNHIRNKLKFGYEYQGEHQVKNISEPVHVYKVLTAPEHAGQVIGEPKTPKRLSKQSYISILAFLALIVATAIWYFYSSAPKIEPASVEKMAYPLPDKPSIAVLPFDNMSGDPKQDYFSDGLTEEIVTALSKIGNMFVIARNTTFTYKGKPVKVQQVAEDLGVRYVIEGSVRKAEERLRISAQLIDALKGHHLWAERYDRDLKDLFVIQDDITKKIISALNVKLTGEEYTYAYEKGTDNLEAYLKLLQCEALSQQGIGIKDGNVLKRQLAEEAIALDPNYAWAYNQLGWTHLNDIYYGMTKDFSKSWKSAFDLGQKARSIDEKTAHILLGSLYQLKGQFDKGVAEAEQLVEFFPNGALAQFTFGRFLMNADRVEEAIPLYKKVLRLDPYAIAPYFYCLGAAYGQYEEAITICKEGLQRFPNDWFTHVILAVAYVDTGNVEEARKSVTEILRINPKASLDWFAKVLHWKNKDTVTRCLDNLRKGGLT